MHPPRHLARSAGRAAPAFRPDGVVTAGTSSPVDRRGLRRVRDEREFAARHGLSPSARIGPSPPSDAILPSGHRPHSRHAQGPRSRRSRRRRSRRRGAERGVASQALACNPRAQHRPGDRQSRRRRHGHRPPSRRDGARLVGKAAGTAPPRRGPLRVATSASAAARASPRFWKRLEALVLVQVFLGNVISGTCRVRTSPLSASGARSTPSTTPASKDCPSSTSSSTLLRIGLLGWTAPAYRRIGRPPPGRRPWFPSCSPSRDSTSPPGPPRANSHWQGRGRRRDLTGTGVRTAPPLPPSTAHLHPVEPSSSR